MRRAVAVAVLVAMCLPVSRSQMAVSAQPASRPAGAWAIVDWHTGAVLASEQFDRVRQPADPGSLIKIATLVAAFAADLASSDTRVPCEGEATVKGQTIRCSHPRLRHPVRPAEAVAVSCNIWFATIGARLPRARLDGTLAAMGLPPTPARAPMPLAAAGLRARVSPPLAWVEALARVLRPGSTIPLSSQGRAALVEGLRGAGLYGTASAFSERGLDVLAKTGTATPAAGGTLGVVVAAWPAMAPTRAIVFIASGIAGKDAADLAAAIVANPPREPKATPPPRRGAPSPQSPPERQSRARPPRRAAPSPPSPRASRRRERPRMACA